MNVINLTGIIRNIRPSHSVGNTQYNRAEIITKRQNGIEDVVDIKFKHLTNPFKDGDNISILGNIRSFSTKIDENKNKVDIYVSTYFDSGITDYSNTASIDGRICKIDGLYITKTHKHVLHFVIANNIEVNGKKLNSYIPCVAWGLLGKSMSTLKVNQKIALTGELHSREFKKKTDDNVTINIAHEFFVTNYELID